MSFLEAYEEFKIYASKRHKKQGFVTLASDFKSKIVPYFSNYNIEDITSKDIVGWQNYIYDLNLKNSYMSKLYIEFSGFMKYCCDFHNLKSNPVKDVGNFKKKFEEKKFDFYTLDEFKLFIKFVDNNIYKQFFNLMFFTGTRPGEAMALKFSDLNNGYISITKNLTTKGGRNLDTPKNQSSIRNIKIDNVLNRDLLKLKKYYCDLYNDCEYDYFVFGGKKPLAPTTINRYKKNACFKANLRVITLHQFRHSHATLLLQNGMYINEVSRRLGHSKTSTTLDIYTHTDLKQEKRVYNTLNTMRFNFFVTLANVFKNLISILKHISMF